MEDYKKKFIEFIATSGMLKFSDFTLKSGRKSPYFFNLGECKTGAGFSKIAEYYAANIAANILRTPSVDYVDTSLKEGGNGTTLFGVAYKGIPLAATTALKLAEKYGIDMPVCYNR